MNGSSCDSTVLGTFDLGYDPASNVTSRAETVKTETGANNPDSGTWTYAYDGAGRMTSSTAPSTTVTTYAYDGAGNRTSVQVGSGNPVTTTYDAASLPTSSSNNTTYTHDAIGELTKIDRSGGTANDWNFVYDSWGNLKSAARKTTGAPDVSYTVDALDRVLSKTAGGTTTSYTYRGTGEDVAKAQVGASTPVFYAFTPSGPLATRTGTDNNTLRYYVRDWHGDVVGVAATSGTNRMKGSILYSPWGEPGARTGEMSASPAQGYLGFQGDLTDASTGQVDMLTRLYEPTLGRFSSRDVVFGEPMSPVSLNQYVYGMGNPVSYADPTGMRPECGVCTAEAEQAGIRQWTRAIAERAVGQALEEIGEIVAASFPVPAVDAPTASSPVVENTDDQVLTCWLQVGRYPGMNCIVVAEVQWWLPTTDGTLLVGSTLVPANPGNELEENPNPEESYWRADAFERSSSSVPSPAQAAEMVRQAVPVGSALKNDAQHRAASFVVDEIAERGSVCRVVGQDGVERTQVQLPHEMDGITGRFEWIVDDLGNLTHQRFVKGGSINGIPNMP